MAHATDEPWQAKPAVWFGLLCQAIADNDFEQAAKAKQNLQRLGVDVQFRNLKKVAGHKSAQPAGEEVTDADR